MTVPPIVDAAVGGGMGRDDGRLPCGEAAYDVVRGLAADLTPDAVSESGHALARAQIPRGELATEGAGVAVFFTELAACTDDVRHAETARRVIAESARRMETLEMDLGLFSGGTGIAWAVHHGALLGVLEPDDSDETDPAAEWDDFLLECLRSSVECPIDVIHGLCGIGIYALARLPRPSAQRMLEVICERLRASSELVEGGRAWTGEDASGTEPPFERDGQFPVGVAHGIAGVIGLLSRIVDRGVHCGAEALLADAVGALLSAVREAGSAAATPRMRDRGQLTWGEPNYSWCWGDIGIAMVLVHAGITMKESTWCYRGLQLANAIGSFCRVEHFGDSSLCHGVAGTCHALSAIARMTGDGTLRHRASSWLAMLLAQRREAGYGGYEFLRRDLDGVLRKQPSPGLLMGSAGVGLALLGSSSGAVNAWEALLFADPPRNHALPAAGL